MVKYRGREREERAEREGGGVLIDQLGGWHAYSRYSMCVGVRGQLTTVISFHCLGLRDQTQMSVLAPRAVTC